MKKTNTRKSGSKFANKKLPNSIVWIYAFISIFVISIIYYREIIDINLTPKFFTLSIFLFLFYLFLGFNKKFKLLDLSLFKRGAVLSWIAFIIISIISLTKAITPAEGIFDILTRVLSALFLILTTSILINTKNIKPFTVIATIVAVVFIVIGFYQYFFHVFRKPSLDLLYNVNGIYSHKNIFSAFFFMLIPFMLYELIRIRNANRFLFATVLLFDLIIIFLLQTRSVWISVFVFLTILTILLLLFRKGIFTNQTKSIYLKGILIIGCTFVLALVISWSLTKYSKENPYYAFKKTQQKTENKSVNQSGDLANLDQRVASIFDSKSKNINQRITVWNYTFKMVKENPILGVGAGNWKILIPTFFDSDYLNDYHHLWRRPHNDYIWILSEKGFLGLITYLVFLVYLLIYTVKILIKSDKPQLKIFVIILLSGIGGYCTFSLFSFPLERIEHQVIFMFFASGIIWVYHHTFPIKSNSNKKTKYLFLSISLPLLIFSIIYGNICIKSEKNTKIANLAIEQKLWDAAITLVDNSYSPLAPLDPRNCPVLYYRGRSYMHLNKIELAKEDLEKAIEQNPYAEYVLVDLGVLYSKEGNQEKSMELFHRALEIYPTYKMALINIAVAHYLNGNLQKALDYFYRCKREGEVDKKLDNTINGILKELEEKEKQQISVEISAKS